MRGRRSVQEKLPHVRTNIHNILKHSFVALLAKRQSKVVADRNVYRGVQVGQVG